MDSKLKSDPTIDYVGIFSDEGISGRKVEKREGYMRMMELVRQGEIKRIYVKSVSRFGRNKLEALRAIQEIRNLNVEIIFEKENLTTADPKCSFYLTMMATFAEQESESLSKNIKWSYLKRLESGDIILQRCYGYDLVEGRLEINESEARWVRKVRIINPVYATRFGMDFYEREHETKMRLLDMMRKWNIDSDAIEAEEPEEFIRDARTLVDGYLRRLLDKKNQNPEEGE